METWVTLLFLFCSHVETLSLGQLQSDNLLPSIFKKAISEITLHLSARVLVASPGMFYFYH